MTADVTVAILAKNMAATLPLYLNCIYNQDYPRGSIHLYIKTNDNTDDTAKILKEWVDTVGSEYSSVYYNDDSVSEDLKNYNNHDWTAFRFEILGKIRQASVEYAMKKRSHYFVADCDNFIKPQTIRAMVEAERPVIGPFLILSPNTRMYSNYHKNTTPDGYFVDDQAYHDIYNRVTPGFHPVDVIHCTYFVRYEVLPQVSYCDKSNRHEYVIFSDTLRKAGIQQWIDTRLIYGYITFAVSEIEFKREFPINDLLDLK